MKTFKTKVKDDRRDQFDLMVGNFVYDYFGEEECIDHIDIRDEEDWGEDDDFKDIEYKPINLNKYWLVGFGFTEIKEVKGGWIYDDGVGDFTLYKNKDKTFDVYFGGSYVKTLYAVHDLQNLFYVLKGSGLMHEDK